MIHPPPLKPGDCIGLACPASAPLKPGIIDAAAHYFESRGHPAIVAPNARKAHGYLAGLDSERAADINSLILNPKVRAIFSIRGGYGTPRLLPLINYSALKRNPKIICGFSDITALQCAIYKKSGLVTFSGAMPGVDLWKNPEGWTETQFWKIIYGRQTSVIKNPSGSPVRCIQAGIAEGPLVCANLSLLVNLLGTPYFPNLKKSILVLEDVGEEVYRLDRMFVHLRNAGVLNLVSGLVLGTFSSSEPRDPTKPTLTLNQLLDDLRAWTSVPILANLQYGHIPKKLTLPVGCPARLDAAAKKLELLEAPTED